MSDAASKALAIEQARQAVHATRRTTVPALEEILHLPKPLLDHGFIRVVDYMGGDEAVVRSARVSYGRGTKQVSEDDALIRYLMRHRHTTPFEASCILIHCQLPLMTARQWIRHRTGSFNETSARYSILNSEFYIPAPENLAAQATTNRQGRGEVLDGKEAEEVLRILKDDCMRNYEHYEWMLNENPDGTPADPSRRGIARELARLNLTLNTYTQWYWRIDLHNFMGFLSLRADKHAQYEIRVYANALMEVLRAWAPMTHTAFLEYRYDASTLSASMMRVVRARLAGKTISREETGMSKREWNAAAPVFWTGG